MVDVPEIFSILKPDFTPDQFRRALSWLEKTLNDKTLTQSDMGFVLRKLKKNFEDGDHEELFLNLSNLNLSGQQVLENLQKVNMEDDFDLESLESILDCFDCEEKDKEVKFLNKAIQSQSDALNKQTSRVQELEKQLNAYKRILNNDLPKVVTRNLLDLAEDKLSPTTSVTLTEGLNQHDMNLLKNLIDHITNIVSDYTRTQLEDVSKKHAEEMASKINLMKENQDFRFQVHNLEENLQKLSDKIVLIEEELSTNRKSFDEVQRKYLKYKKIAIYLTKLNAKMSKDLEVSISELSIEQMAEAVNEAAERGDVYWKIEKKEPGTPQRPLVKSKLFTL